MADESSYGDDNEREPRRRRRRNRRTRIRLKWVLLGGLLVALIGAYFLPSIVANSPLNRLVLDPIDAKINGKLRYESATVGWFAPVTVSGVTIVDDEEQLVASISKLTTSASLLQLLNESSYPGQITLQTPVLNAVIRRDDSNIEDLLRPILDDTTDGVPLNVKVVVVDGAVRWADERGENTGEVRAIQAELDCRTGEKSIEWKAAAELVEGRNSGTLSCEGETRFGESSTGKLVWQSKGAPLAGLKIALSRVDPQLHCGGALTSDGELQWDSAGCLATLSEFEVQELELAGAAVLEGDRLRTNQFSAIGTIYAGAEDIRCRGLALSADWGQLTLSCDLQTAEIRRVMNEQSWTDLVSVVRGDARGWVDLAQLTQTLPRATRLRKDTIISEGGLTFRIANVDANRDSARDASAAVTRTIDLQLDTRPIVAQTAGQTIQWRDPIQVVASATLNNRGWTINQLTCRSDFLTVEGAGPPDRGKLTLHGDLGQLRKRLEQFIDLQGIELDGAVQGQGSWIRTAESMNIGGELKINRFSLKLDDDRRWEEPNVAVSATTTLRRDQSNRWGVDNWRGELAIDNDSLGVEPQADGYLVHLVGDAKRWLRVAEAVGLSQLHNHEIAGRIDAQALVLPGVDALEVRSAAAEVQDLVYRSDANSLVIREPNVAASVSGRWQFEPPRWTTREAELRSSTLSLATTNLTLAVSPNLEADAALSLRGDLQRIGDVLGTTLAPYALAGTVVGKCDLSAQGDLLSLQWEVGAERFSATKTPHPGQPRIARVGRQQAIAVWQEPNLRTVGKIAMNLKTRDIRIEQAECNTDWLAVATQGDLTVREGASQIDVKGAMTYDWPTAMDRLALTQNGQIKVYGQQSQTFAIRGPLTSSTDGGANDSSNRAAILRPNEGLQLKRAGPAPLGLTATSAIGWDRAEAYGFRIGPATLRSQLRDRLLIFDPVHVDVNDGKATLTPTIDLSQSPGAVNLKRGDGIRQINLTAEMCRGWLKYVAPLLADSTRAQGNLSLELEQAAAPIYDFSALSSKGVLVIHEAQVGPGSLITKLTGPITQILSVVDPQSAADLARPNWIQIPKQDVEFQVQQGRVYHKQLVLRHRDVEIRTTGSVGFDQSLDLVAEVPVLDRWIKNNRFLESLRGKSIPFRVRGSFAKPNVDESVLRQLARDSAKGATEQLLKDQIERGLKKLFK